MTNLYTIYSNSYLCMKSHVFVTVGGYITLYCYFFQLICICFMMQYFLKRLMRHLIHVWYQKSYISRITVIFTCKKPFHTKSMMLYILVSIFASVTVFKISRLGASSLSHIMIAHICFNIIRHLSPNLSVISSDGI